MSLKQFVFIGVLIGLAAPASAHWSCWSRDHRAPVTVDWNEKSLTVSFHGHSCDLSRVKYATHSPLYRKWWKFDNLNKQSATYRTVCQNVGTPLFSTNMTEEIDLYWIKVSRNLLHSRNGTIHVGFEKPGGNGSTDAFFYCTR